MDREYVEGHLIAESFELTSGSSKRRDITVITPLAMTYSQQRFWARCREIVDPRSVDFKRVSTRCGRYIPYYLAVRARPMTVLRKARAG